MVRARVEILDIEDLVPEEGGLRDITRARIFLPIVPGDIYTFVYIGPPTPAEWLIIANSPTVVSPYLLLDPSDIVRTQKLYSSPQTVRTRMTFPTGSLDAQNWGLAFSAPVNARFRIVSDTSIQIFTGNSITFESTTVPVPDLRGTTHEFTIIWTEEKVEYYMDDLLLVTHSTYVPDVDCYYEISGGSSGGETKVQYVAMGADPNTIDYWFMPQDHFLIREVRYAQIKEALTTHLQVELLVQEVIPDA